MGYLSQYKGLSNLIGWERERTSKEVTFSLGVGRLGSLERDHGAEKAYSGGGARRQTASFTILQAQVKNEQPLGEDWLCGDKVPALLFQISSLAMGRKISWTSLFTEKCLCILLGCTRSHSILHLLYCIVLYSESFFFFFLISWIQKLVLLLACFKNVNEGTVSFLI